MGYYINPEKETKEDWLRDKGVRTGALPWGSYPKDKCLVCLLDNGPFTAAGVIYNEREHHAFTDPSDPRDREYYLVLKSDVIGVSDIELEAFK